MATGILGTADLAATTETTVYTVPANTFSVVTINVTNRNPQSRSIRVALAADASATNEEWIEFDAELLGSGVLERSGIVLDEDKRVIVYSNSTDISVVVYGIETPTS